MSDAVLDEVLEEIIDVVCRAEGCGRKLVPDAIWRATPPAEREEMKADGYFATGSAREALCKAHYAQALAAGDLDTTQTRSDFESRVARYNALRSSGMSRRDIAAELGTTRNSLNRSLSRARAQGMEVLP